MYALLKIENIQLSPGANMAALTAETARILHIQEKDILSLKILRRSIDAREDVNIVYTVETTVKDEPAVLKRHHKKVSRMVPKPDYFPPDVIPTPEIPPVVVGAGPAGLFAALILARAGARPILLERGRPTEMRKNDVERFWSSGVLDTSSNVQFGEGGAGAFSDGKLNTGTKDLRHRFILKQLVSCGAPEDILIDTKPHIGTDYLHIVLKNMRQELLSLGADIRFESQLTDLTLQSGALHAITVKESEKTYTLPCRHLILCPGHSARDTFDMLYNRGVPMESKPFAVGVRIEHRQEDIDSAQYKQYAGHPGLPVSSYKLSCHLANGRSVFSFCVCPGGEVVAAASERNQVVTNGMSEFARAKENINGALLVNITPADFGSDLPLAGISFQRKLEAAAFTLGKGNYKAPAQRVEDFLAKRPSLGPGRITPSYRPAVTWTNLWDCLPDFIAESIAQALPLLGRKLQGYDAPDAVLTAVESRSSSPVRILRDKTTCESPIRGLFPCGEGAGYAGGILSAAADGMRCAEQVCQFLSYPER